MRLVENVQLPCIPPRAQASALRFKNRSRALRTKGRTDPVTWAAEYEIDYAASVEDIAIPAAWVRSARKLHDMWRACEVEYDEPKRGIAGLDVGGGTSKSVFVTRHGAAVGKSTAWRRAPYAGREMQAGFSREAV